MSEESMLIRFREKDSKEGVTRATVRRIAKTLDLSETAAVHRALVEFAQRYVPRYERDNGEITKAQLAKIRALVRKKHGEAVVVDSLFDLGESAPEPTVNARKRVSATRIR
jgi:hypothetical protein